MVQKNVILHCNNVCQIGGTMLFTYDLIRSLPEFHHILVYFHDVGENYDLIGRMEYDGIDVSNLKKLTPTIVDEINPSLVILNNTAGKQVDDEFPYKWITNRPLLAIHHNPTHPLFPADLDIFVSQNVKVRYNNCIKSGSIRKWNVIPPCIDTKTYTSIKRTPNNKRCVIGKLSNDNVKKFPESLLNILKEVKNQRRRSAFKIVGGSKYYDSDLKGLKMPLVGSKSPRGFYSDFDILVYQNCSDITESWCRVITEAMAAGLPVVSENRGGPAEQIIHGETGFLCDNDEQFVEHLIELSDDQQLRYGMGMKARERASMLYDIGRFRDKILQVIIGA